MHTLILEDWLTVSGPGGVGDVITQDETRWLDLEAFQDVVLYLECREALGATTATVTIQTAPTKDDSLFQTVATTTFTAGATPVLFPVILASATTPLARYLRWQITGPAGNAWDATFRVLVAANSPGM